jgi:transcriptional regulator with XRE-family HTH domain
MPRKRGHDADALCFGEMITAHRLRRGWTIEDLSRRSGMNATYLGVLERGFNMPGILTILRLAEVFGMEGADLVREFEHARRQAEG